MYSLTFGIYIVLKGDTRKVPTVEEIQRALHQSLEKMQLSHTNDERELAKVKHSLSACESNEQNFKQDLQRATEEVSPKASKIRLCISVHLYCSNSAIIINDYEAMY